MDGDETFGERLKRLRLEAGLSQRELAGIQFDPSYITLLEKDRRQPAPATVEVLATRLGCSAQMLRDGRTDPEETVILASAELGLGNPLNAIQALEPIALDLASRPIVRAFDFNAIEILATALERSGDFQNAIKWLERLRDAADADPKVFPLLRVSVALVRCYRDIGEYLAAIQIGERSIAVHQSLHLNDTATYGALVSSVALAYAQSGNPTYASVMLTNLADDAERNGNVEIQAYAYWNAAITATQQGRVADGKALIDRASALLQSSDDLRNKSRIRAAKASLLLKQKPPDPETARDILRQELPNLRQHNGAVSVARAEAELARCELLLGRAPVALRLSKSSLEKLPQSHSLDVADTRAVFGAALIANGEVAVGIGEIEAAADALLVLGATHHASTTLAQLAQIHRSLGNDSAAFDCAERALATLGINPNPTPAPQAQQQTSKRQARTSSVLPFSM